MKTWKRESVKVWQCESVKVVKCESIKVSISWLITNYQVVTKKMRLAIIILCDMEEDGAMEQCISDIKAENHQVQGFSISAPETHCRVSWCCQPPPSRRPPRWAPVRSTVSSSWTFFTPLEFYMLDQRCADTEEPVDPVGPYSGSGFSQLSIRIPTAVKQVITNQGSSHDLEAIEQ